MSIFNSALTLFTSIGVSISECEDVGVYFFPNDIYPIPTSDAMTGYQPPVLHCFTGILVPLGENPWRPGPFPSDSNPNGPENRERVMRIKQTVDHYSYLTQCKRQEIRFCVKRAGAPEEIVRQYIRQDGQSINSVLDSVRYVKVKLPHFATHAGFDDGATNGSPNRVALLHADRHFYRYPYQDREDSSLFYPSVPDEIGHDVSRWSFILNLETYEYWPLGLGIVKPRHSPYFHRKTLENMSSVNNFVYKYKVSRRGVRNLKHEGIPPEGFSLQSGQGYRTAEDIYTINTFIRAMEWLIDIDKKVIPTSGQMSDKKKLVSGIPYYSEER